MFSLHLHFDLQHLTTFPIAYYLRSYYTRRQVLCQRLCVAIEEDLGPPASQHIKSLSNRQVPYFTPEFASSATNDEIFS